MLTRESVSQQGNVQGLGYATGYLFTIPKGTAVDRLPNGLNTNE